MDEKQGIGRLFPGDPLTDIDVRRLIRSLEGREVSFFFVVMTDGSIGTYPPFKGGPTVPDMPSLLRQLADKMVQA